VSTPLLSNEAIAAGLQTLDWERDGDKIVKTVTKKDFVGSLEYVNRVGELAEQSNHHPDIAISWNTVTLRLSTHSAGGLTQLDLDLARAVDGLGA
jgi:4a-hydroxytetrahydrobiopterin dehydratase